MKTPQTRKIKKPIGLAIRSRVRAGDMGEDFDKKNTQNCKLKCAINAGKKWHDNCNALQNFADRTSCEVAWAKDKANCQSGC